MSATPRALAWLIAGRRLPRVAFVAACAAAVIVLAYAAENWRGKRAWEQCRTDLEAHGAALDWTNFVQPQVPDEQNIFKAAGITEWFVKDPRAETGPNELQRRIQAGLPALMKTLYASTNFLLLATIQVTNGISADVHGAVWRMDDPGARKDAARLVSDAIGPVAAGAQSFLLLVPPTTMIEPATVYLQPSSTPERIRDLFPASHELPGTSRIQVKESTNGTCEIWLAPPAGIAAQDYLQWSAATLPDLELLREATKRPRACINDSPVAPYAGRIPEFQVIRVVAQMIAERAESYLLLGKPDRALRELELIETLSRILGGGPENRSVTLVAAMMQVAFTSLYVNTVADGLRLGAWRDSELAALQKQLERNDLLDLLQRAIRYERAASCQLLLTARSGELDEFYSIPSTHRAGVPQKLKSPHAWVDHFAPRGWIYQNMAAIASREQRLLDDINVANHSVSASKIDAIKSELRGVSRHWSPYASLAAVTVPNFSRAAQNCARIQSLTDQARVACALERFRLSRGEYPETLDALVPGFAELLPHDVISGQPLKYRRKPDGGFLLYSVGWNGKDDGGNPGRSPLDEDWVWAYPDLRTR
jgi:hypothetical protein